MYKLVLKNKFLFFLLLLFFYFFSRIYFLGRIPGSVYWDEASIGYNAYSVLKTGRDEWGEFLPLHFRAFGEFKLPVYIYSTIPFIYFLGLNELSVRIPSVLYSFFSLFLIYFIVKKIFNSDFISFFSAFLFSVFPWDFIFSRTGYEASAGLFFYLLFIFIWFYFNPFVITQKKKFLGFIALMFLLFSLVFSIYSYNSFRFWAPLTFLFFLFYFFFSQRKFFWKNIIFILVSVLFLAVSFYPIFRLYSLDYGMARYQAVSLQGGLIEKMAIFLRNYLYHFSFEFLFTKGDSNLRSQISGFGQIYIISFPFIVLGIWKILKRINFNSLFLLFLLLIAPVPASLTKEAPHSLRSILFAFVLPVLVSLGVSVFTGYFKSIKNWLILIIVLSYTVFFVAYLRKFVKSYNILACSGWQCEYKGIFVKRAGLINESGRVVISDIFAQPYIFALFYNKFDPLEFRKSVVYNPPDKWGFSTAYSFDKFIFKPSEETDLETADLVFSDKEFNNLDGFLVDKIVLPDNKTVFWVYKK